MPHNRPKPIGAEDHCDRRAVCVPTVNALISVDLHIHADRFGKARRDVRVSAQKSAEATYRPRRPLSGGPNVIAGSSLERLGGLALKQLTSREDLGGRRGEAALARRWAELVCGATRWRRPRTRGHSAGGRAGADESPASPAPRRSQRRGTGDRTLRRDLERVANRRMRTRTPGGVTGRAGDGSYYSIGWSRRLVDIV